MALDLKLWSATFSKDGLPAWPCPCCRDGRLVISEKDVKVVEPAFSRNAHTRDEWELDWTVERFVAVMKCADPKCGELVIVAGDTQIVELHDDEFGYGISSALRPRSVFPAPPIIAIPKETPDTVVKEIELAFQLFWSDLGASATRLRTSAERLLDDFKIPKTILNSKNERVFRSLASRIKLFAKKVPNTPKVLKR